MLDPHSGKWEIVGGPENPDGADDERVVDVVSKEDREACKMRPQSKVMVALALFMMLLTSRANHQVYLPDVYKRTLDPGRRPTSNWSEYVDNTAERAVVTKAENQLNALTDALDRVFGFGGYKSPFYGYVLVNEEEFNFDFAWDENSGEYDYQIWLGDPRVRSDDIIIHSPVLGLDTKLKLDPKEWGFVWIQTLEQEPDEKTLVLFRESPDGASDGREIEFVVARPCAWVVSSESSRVDFALVATNIRQ